MSCQADPLDRSADPNTTCSIGQCRTYSCVLRVDAIQLDSSHSHNASHFAGTTLLIFAWVRTVFVLQRAPWTF